MTGILVRGHDNATCQLFAPCKYNIMLMEKTLGIVQYSYFLGNMAWTAYTVHAYLGTRSEKGNMELRNLEIFRDFYGQLILCLTIRKGKVGQKQKGKKERKKRKRENEKEGYRKGKTIAESLTERFA